MLTYQLQNSFCINYLGIHNLVYSTSWKFTLNFVHNFRGDWRFLPKFGSSYPGFIRRVLAPPYLKFEISAHEQIAVIHYLQVSWHYMGLKLTLGILFDKWSWSLILSTWSRDFFWKWVLVGKFCSALLPNLLHPKVSYGLFKCCHFY